MIFCESSKAVLFVDPFCYLCFNFIFVILSCLFLADLWSPASKATIMS